MKKYILISFFLCITFFSAFGQDKELVGELLVAPQKLMAQYLEGKESEIIQETLPAWLSEYQRVYCVIDSLTLTGDYHLTLVGEKGTKLYNLGNLEHQALWTLTHCYIYFENTNSLAFSCSTPGRNQDEVSMYEISDNKFHKILTVSHDQSEEQAQQVKSLLAENKNCEAVQLMDQIAYLSNYLNKYVTACNAARNAKEKAKELAKKDKKAAFEELFCVLEGLDNLGAISLDSVESKEVYDQNEYAICMTFEDYLQMMIDVGQYGEQSNQLDAAEKYLKYANRIAPMNKNILLSLGNVYWKQEKKTPAKHVYKTYISIMKKQKKRRQVPRSIRRRARGK
jgi:hypothetical protein